MGLIGKILPQKWKTKDDGSLNLWGKLNNADDKVWKKATGAALEYVGIRKDEQQPDLTYLASQMVGTGENSTRIENMLVRAAERNGISVNEQLSLYGVSQESNTMKINPLFIAVGALLLLMMIKRK